MLELCFYYLVLGAAYSLNNLGLLLLRKRLHLSKKAWRYAADIIIFFAASLAFFLLKDLFFDPILHDIFLKVKPTELQNVLCYTCAFLPTALMIIIGWRTGLFKTEPVEEDKESSGGHVEINGSTVSLEDPEAMRRNMDKL